MSVAIRHDKAERRCKISLAVNGQTVGSLLVQDCTMRLAGAWVRMGGIADVVIHPAHRGKGYGVRLLQAAVAYMREERYPVSILFGIPDFYHRFGYAPVLPEYELSIATRDAESLAVTGNVCPARAEERQELLALYTRVNASRTGTVRRTVGSFRPLAEEELPEHEWWIHPRRILVAAPAGTLTGYVMLSGDPAHFRVFEVVVPAEHVPTAGAGLIATLAEEAAVRRLQRIHLPLPPDEPLAVFLRRLGCKVTITYNANEGGMGRIVHLDGLAEALTPALAPRVAALPAAERPGRLEFVCPEGSAGMTLGEGRTLRLTLPPPQLCQLVMGYRSIDEISVECPNAVAPGDLPVVRTLFPAGYPHMWDLDRF